MRIPRSALAIIAELSLALVCGAASLAAAATDAIADDNSTREALLTREAASHIDTLSRTRVFDPPILDATLIQFSGALSTIDRAERALLLPSMPPNIHGALDAWRVLLDRLPFDAAPWQRGPITIELHPSLAPIEIPTGWRVLMPADVQRLRARFDPRPRGGDNPYRAIQRQLPADDNYALVYAEHGHSAARLILLPTAGRIKWAISPPVELLHALRLAPLTRVATRSLADFDPSRIGWLHEPTLDSTARRAEWMRATGWQTTSDRASEAVATWVIAGHSLIAMMETIPASQDATANAVVGLAAIWKSVAFQPTWRYDDGNPRGSDNNRQIDTLVVDPKVLGTEGYEPIARKEGRTFFDRLFSGVGFLFEVISWISIAVIVIGVIVAIAFRSSTTPSSRAADISRSPAKLTSTQRPQKKNRRRKR